MQYSKCLMVLFVVSLCFGEMAFAAGKPKPKEPEVPFTGKRVVRLLPVQNVQIQMPDQSWHNFGEDFQARLTTKLMNSGLFLVADEPTGQPPDPETAFIASVPPDYVWPGTHVPAASVKISVDVMTFATGSRGSRMYYGFDERFRTSFNNGSMEQINEFPLKPKSANPSWFGNTFDAKGQYPFDSRSGLSLDEGFSIDALYAWLTVKYATYQSNLNLTVQVDSDLTGIHYTKKIRVSGFGFFVDVVGAYQGFSGGIMIARRDAMLQAFRKAIDGAYEALAREMKHLPLTGKIDALVDDQGQTLALIGSGHDARVVPGVLYETVGVQGVYLKVLKSTQSGAIAEIVQGDEQKLRPGQIVKQVQSLPKSKSELASATLASSYLSEISKAGETLSEKVDLPPINLDPGELPVDDIPYISRETAYIKSLAEIIFLPYMIWRYFSYDQVYKKKAEAKVTHKDEPKELQEGEAFLSEAIATRGSSGWFKEAKKEAWAKKIGLDRVKSADAGRGVLVAVIDSGVDYNHPVLRPSIWKNPKPTEDFRGEKDRYGWDFISGDPRPFDDHYHGSHVASSVIAVAPGAQILPVKVFNPYGVTSSAALNAGIRYAVDRGAKIVVCAWATRTRSRALEEAIRYAAERGVVVVSAAGDSNTDLNRHGRYPASFSPELSNLLAVTAVDELDRLIARDELSANKGTEVIQIAAPGKNIRVTEPRSRYDRDTSTGIAAGLTAGALAHIVAERSGAQPRDWIEVLLQRADQIEALKDSVRDGRRLRVAP